MRESAQAVSSITRAPDVGAGLHALSWLVWAISAAAAVQLAPSPVYTTLLIGIAALVVEVSSSGRGFARAFPILVGLGVAFALLRVTLTALTTHAGGTSTVLFTAPEFTMPKLLGAFTVGGTIELEVVLQAVTEGLAIVAVMAVFGAFNAVVSHYELVQAAPRAFYELGLVVTVALAFVPSTLASVAIVRDADRCRTGGHVVRRGRLLRQAVPVVEMGLERAIALAESMDARGFGFGGATRADFVGGWCGFGALLALGGAFVALVGRSVAVASALGVVGLALVGCAVACTSRTSERARYRHRRLTRDDRLLIGASLVAPLALAALALFGDDTLTWTAAPLRWPDFGLLPVLALASLAAPTVILRRGGSAPRSARSLAGVS